MKVKPDIPGLEDPGPGRRLGIDVGTVRIGVAVSDRDSKLAMPVETIARETGFHGRDLADVDRLLQLIADYQVVEIIVGLPTDLKGDGSASVKQAKEIAFRIKRRLAKQEKTIPVRLGDERLTTVVATQALRSAGVSEKAGRSVIDQAAAVEILQSWLDGRASALRTLQANEEAQDQPTHSNDSDEKGHLPQ